MSKAVPWSIKGVDFDVREAAKEAARRDGLTLGEWMNRAIAERAAEIGVSAQEFDADEQLEAVAAQLARLSREAEEDSAPQRRRGEAARRVERGTAERAAPARSEEAEWREDLLRERAARRQAAPERPATRPAARDFFARSEQGEGLTERAVHAPPADPRRDEPAPPRHREESDVAAPLRGMIATVQDRLGDIESRLTRRDRSADDRPLRGALERLEGRIDAMSRRAESAGDDSPLRQLEARLGAILSRLERVEASPPGAARDEQFVRLEKRMDALMTRLDRPAPPPAAPPRRALVEAVAEIAERQRDLDSAASRAPRPPSPQLTALLDERFEALSRKFDLAAARSLAVSPPAADPARVDQLQDGIQALSGRIEDMRRDFLAAGANSRAAVESLARDLSARVETALAAPSNAGAAGLAELRRDIAALSRSLGDMAPRAAVAGLDSAMRDLANRVDSAREAMQRSAQARPTSSAELEALGKQVAAMSRALDDLAPRSQVTSLENAVRALTARIERSRDEGMREAVLAPIESLADDVRRALAEAGASANFDGVSRQLREVESKIEHLRESGGADRSDFLQVYDQSEQIRGMIAQAMEKMAPIERLERQVGDLGERLEEVARQTQAANAARITLPWGEIESRLSDLASRIDRAGLDRAAPAVIDDARFDDISRRLEVLHDTLASRIDRAGLDRAAPAPAFDESRFDDLSRRLDGLHEALAARNAGAPEEWRAPAPVAALEPLLRSLSERLDAEPVAQIGPEAIASLERRITDISKRLESGDTEAERRLLRAIDQIAERLDIARDPEGDDRNAREIADLREKAESSDRRAQQTLSAVHETLEKVVDRLAMIEEDVIEARGAAEAAARAPLAASEQERRAGSAAPAFDEGDFLREPGAGHPAGRREAERRAARAETKRSLALDEAEMDDEMLDAVVFGPKERLEDDDIAEPKPAQTNYIEVARRALAARIAAEAAEKAEANRKAAETIEPPREKEPESRAARFVRPDSQRRKGGSARMPALAFTAVSALAIAGYQAYRLFENQTPPMQAVATPPADKAQAGLQGGVQAGAPAGEAAPARPVDAPASAAPAPAAPAPAAAPAIPGQSSLTPTASGPTATLNSAPIVPSAVIAPKSAKSGKTVETADAAKSNGLPDPLATGSIGGGRPNTLSAVQSGVQSLTAKELAERGDAAAQYDYGARLAEGRGVAQDKTAAIGWLEKAAAQGLPQAQYRLGAIYEKGLGAPRDPAKARDYYEKAANQGNVRAMHNLAVTLAEGVDGKPDYAAAAQWFQRAADYGVRDSQFNLAILYARGMGVPQNLGRSYYWFGVAALQGDEDAAKKRDEVAAQLDAASLAGAKKQVADFHARTPLAAVNDPPAIAPGPGASAAAVSAAVSKVLSKI